MNSTTIIKPLFIFYILLAGTGSNELLGKQFRTYIEENRLAKHIIAFTAFLTAVIIYGNPISVTQAIAYSLVGYTVFILSTKLDVQWNIIILLLLLAGFLYESHTEIAENKLMTDNNIDITTIKKTIDKNHKYKLYIGLLIVAVIIIGLTLYNNKKHEQYGGGFDLTKFIFY